ncbi:hypothetical protein K501DRAFT_335275 [Backusella circina FSU 941]|nr:hypothetical protein K501DRAFT_335275 [Backusella circina FSU 941]
MKLNSLSYLASILFLLFCFLLQLISALQQPVSTLTNVDLSLKRRQDNYKPNYDSDKSLPSKKNDLTITEINVTLTTIVYGSAQPTIHNASNTAAARQQQQQQSSSSSSVNDPNAESLKSKLEEDQAALRRMIMILSLVGGLGVIAVVATVVIFTRMRARNRKQREVEEEEGNEDSIFELSEGIDQQSEDSISPGSTQDNTSHHHQHNDNDDHDNDDHDNNGDNPKLYIEPSAPPALMMVASSSSSFHNNTDEQRRHIVSMLSQTTAPSPSAPTAKELDAMIDEEAAAQQPTTSNYLQGHSHSYGSPSTVCNHCSPLMTPEPPPPAYTPSAPPHYALPVEPVHESVVLSPRRHSLGG